MWQGYDQGWNLVTSNLLGCDGFEVMQDVLSDILPKLNVNSAKTNAIQRPIYDNMEEDNIYTYLNMYNAFLMFEQLGTTSRTYTAYEQAVYITTDLDRDTHHRFDKGISHVRMQLKHSTDGISVSKDITASKIAKTICKYSPEYKVGEFAVATETDAPVIRALRQNKFNPSQKTKDYQPYKKQQPNNSRYKRDNSLKCNYCGQLGHDSTSEDGCFVFAKWTMCQQTSSRLSTEDTKMNTRKYLKNIRQKQSNNKQRSNVDKHIRTLMEAETDLNVDTTALIKTLQLLQPPPLIERNSDSSECSSDDDSDF